MQLSASSTFLDLLAAPSAAPGGQSALPAAGPSSDASVSAAAADFGALLSAQAKPAVATENLLGAPTAAPGSILNPTGAAGEGSPAPLAANVVTAPAITLPAASVPISGEPVIAAEVAAESQLSAQPRGSTRPEVRPSAAVDTSSPAVQGAPLVDADAAKRWTPRRSAAVESSPAVAAPAPRSVPSPAMAAPTYRAPQPGNVARDSGKTKPVAEGHQDASPQLAAEITAAWLAANGSTVLVANPAGELITVDISLGAPDAKAGSLAGAAAGIPATEGRPAPVTVGAQDGGGASLAGNSLLLSDRPAIAGTPALLDTGRPMPDGTPLPAAAAEPTPTRDQRSNEGPTATSLSPHRPAYPMTAADTQAHVAGSHITPATHAASSVNISVPGMPVTSSTAPLAASSMPAATSTNDEVASPNSRTAPADEPAAAAAMHLSPVITRVGATPSGLRTGGLSAETSRGIAQPANDGVSPSVSPSDSTAVKIAGAFDAQAGATSPVRQAKLKNVLASSDEQLTDRSGGFGINVAKRQARMPALAHPTPSPFAENDPRSFAAAPLTFDTLVQDTSETAASPFTGSARRAVESAMAVVDHFSKSTQRGVNLQFSVSGLDLAVRVEMRPDGVHTIFRTDSPELRNALAQEWQSVVNTQPADRPQRLADPVFTSTSAGGPTSGDHGASQQRESGTPQSQWEKATAFAPPAVARAGTEAAAAAASTGPRLAPHGTARHLSALA